MPEINDLMQEWQEPIENILREVPSFNNIKYKYKSFNNKNNNKNNIIVIINISSII